MKKKTAINGIQYTPTVGPDVLKVCLLIVAHDKQGHNEFKRTYSSLKQMYPWKGMKKTIQRHMQHMCKAQHKSPTNPKGTL